MKMRVRDNEEEKIVILHKRKNNEFSTTAIQRSESRSRAESKFQDF